MDFFDAFSHGDDGLEDLNMVVVAGFVCGERAFKPDVDDEVVAHQD